MDSIIEDHGEVIKMSLTKDKWAFPKTRRFSPVKVVNHNISYEPKMSDFERVNKTSPKRNNDQLGMGGSSPRFEYYSNRRKHGAFPSSQTYNSPTISTSKGQKSFLNQPNK